MIVVRTLGAAEIAIGDCVLKPTSTKKFALLLYLAAERGRHTTRAALQELLFPRLPEKNARHALRELVYQLRQLGAPLEADNDGVGLPSEAVRSDYSEVMEAERLSDDQVRAVEGGFLPGYAPGHSESYSEWLDAHRAVTVSGLCRRALHELEAIGRYQNTIRRERLARACLSLDPLNERATRVLAECLLQSASRAEANAILTNYRTEVGRALSVQCFVDDSWAASVQPPRDNGRFVGREREMQTMLERLDACSASGRSVFVTGNAGIGKSRLLREFATMARLRRATVIETHSYPSDVTRPLSVLSDTLPKLLDSPGALGCSPHSLERLKAAANGGGHYSETRLNEEDRDATFTSIRELIEAITDESPLVILLDDFHWADNLSRAFFEDILHAHLPRLLIVYATRESESVPGVGATESQLALRLRPLNEEALQLTIRTELPAGTPTLTQWLCESCAGNPLYLQLLIAQARSNPEARGIPPAMADAIDICIARLSPDARGVLLYAALLGRHLTVQRLLRLTSRGPLEITLALDELVRNGLIPDTALQSVALHALIAERIKDEASAPVLHAATRCVAQLLTDDAGAAGASLAWDAAHLWLGVGEQDQASRLIEITATHALQLGRARESAQLLRGAAQLSAPKERPRLLIAAATIAARSNELDLLLDVSQELRIAGETDPPIDIRIAELHARLCWGSDYSALNELQHLLASAPTSAQRTQAAIQLLRVADAERDHSLAEAAFAELRPLIESAECDELTRLKVLICYHASFGDREVACEFAEKGLSFSETMPDYLGNHLKRIAGVAFFRAGQVERAMSAWISAFRAAEASQSTRSQFETAVLIASTANDVGNTDLALEWNRAAECLIDQIPDLANTLVWLVHVADTAVCRDDLPALLECRRRFIARTAGRINRRAGRWLRALDAHIDLLRPRPQVDERTVSSLLSEQQPGNETGDASDFEMSAVLRLCLHMNDAAAAKTHIERYLFEFRVRRAPLWSSLSQAIARLGRLGDLSNPDIRPWQHPESA